MRRYFDDRTNRPVPAEECTVLKVAGPLASMTGRREFHLDKSNALALAVWLGYPVARPDVPVVAGPDPSDYLADARKADATAADLAALRVQALANGQAAGSKPPAPRPRARPRKPA